MNALPQSRNCIIAAIACLPFLFRPTGIFGAPQQIELLAAGLAGLLIIFSAPSFKKPPSITTSTLLALTLVSGILIQSIINPGIYLSQTAQPLSIAVTALFFSLALSQTCTNRAQALLALSYGLIIGGSANIIGCFIQIAINISDSNNLQIDGLIGQRNLLVSYLMLSILSALHLARKGKLPLFALWIYIILSGTIISFTGSRAALIYPVIIFGVYFFTPPSERRRSGALYFGCALTLLAVIAFSPTIFSKLSTKYSINAQPSPHSSVYRLNAATGGSSDIGRVNEAIKTIWLIKQHPIAGYGWGKYAFNSTSLQASQSLNKIKKGRDTLFTHSHNIILQLIHDNGTLIGGLLIVLFLTQLHKLTKKQNQTEESNTIFLMILMLLVHSMIEFPLWNGHFLLLFFLILSIPCSEPHRLTIPKTIVAPALIIAGSAITIGCSVLSFHLSVFSDHAKPKWGVAESKRDVAVLENFRSKYFFDMAADMALLAHYEPLVPVPDIKIITDKLTITNPTPSVLLLGYNLDIEANNSVKAAKIAHILTCAYPNSVARQIVLSSYDAQKFSVQKDHIICKN